MSAGMEDRGYIIQPDSGSVDGLHPKAADTNPAATLKAERLVRCCSKRPTCFMWSPQRSFRPHQVVKPGAMHQRRDSLVARASTQPAG